MARGMSVRKAILLSRSVSCLLLCALIMLGGCRGVVNKTRPRLLTPIDYITFGVLGVERFIVDSSPSEARELRDSIELASRAVVLVEVRWDEHESRETTTFSSSTGTGVLLNNGTTVLTAGHVLSGLVPGSEIDVRYQGQTISKPRVIGIALSSGSPTLQDWGQLSVALGAGGSSLSLGAPGKGELVVAVGFPGGFGISHSGNIVETGNLDILPRPIPLIGRVLSTDPLRVELLAGSLPPEGMSGSPLVDLNGRCVGVMSGVEVIHHGDGRITQSIKATRPNEDSDAAIAQ